MRRIESVTKAYHSTRQKGLKKFESRTTTATIDTGEGAHVHGWGLYLQSDEMANREDYYNMLGGNYNNSKYNDKIITIWGQEFLANETEDMMFINEYESITIYDFTQYGKTPDLSSGEELLLLFLVNGIGPYTTSEFMRSEMDWLNSDLLDENYETDLLTHYTIEDMEEARRLADELNDNDYMIENVIPEEETLEDGTHNPNVSQYTVEIPDDMVFIDEDKYIPEWLSTLYVDEFGFTVKENEFGQIQTFNYNDIANEEYLNNYINEPNNFMDKEMFEDIQIKRRSLIEDLKEERKNTIKHYTLNYTGEAFYNMLSDELEGQEQASLWLSENGIDGMTYEGGRDHGCFVIYNCDKLKIVGEY